MDELSGYGPEIKLIALILGDWHTAEGFPLRPRQMESLARKAELPLERVERHIKKMLKAHLLIPVDVDWYVLACDLPELSGVAT